jgi:hypothetical protein
MCYTIMCIPDAVNRCYGRAKFLCHLHVHVYPLTIKANSHVAQWRSYMVCRICHGIPCERMFSLVPSGMDACVCYAAEPVSGLLPALWYGCMRLPVPSLLSPHGMPAVCLLPAACGLLSLCPLWYGCMRSAPKLAWPRRPCGRAADGRAIKASRIRA